ncbi:MAG: hypothetical protein HYY35_09730 [Deltaproteobacteria bacterium]|nr:hypothetical protein [Deltaproteobacteria bacterium]
MAILGIVLLASAGVSAAERGAAAGSGSALQLDALSKLDVGDVAGHELVQSVGEDELKTPDRIGGVSFEGAKAKVFRQSDLVDGAGMIRGYATWAAPTGEKLFVIFGYTVPPFPAGKDSVPFEGTFEWAGGTGSLQKIAGKGTIEGEISRRGEARYRWAGSYEQATQ